MIKKNVLTISFPASALALSVIACLFWIFIYRPWPSNFPLTAALTPELLAKEVAQRYPAVWQAHYAEIIADVASDGSVDDVLLIDTRTPEEYSVSHIPGAILYEDTPEFWKRLSTTQQEIIAYCSLGYRSSETALGLQKKGISGVSSLQGGIFDWASRGFPLVDSSGEGTEKVHPFNSRWAPYLPEELHSELP